MIKCESSNLNVRFLDIYAHIHTQGEKEAPDFSFFPYDNLCFMWLIHWNISNYITTVCHIHINSTPHTHFRWLVAKHFFLIRAWLSWLSRLVWFPVRKSKLEKDTQSVQFYIQIELNRTAIAYSTFIESGHPFAWND